MRVKELKIYSPKIKEQAEFYSKVLGLKIVELNKESVYLRFGDSMLIIEYKPEATPYHFAINIPGNKDLEALAWLKTRVKILKKGTNEIQDFYSWNAKAIYFYDKDKNIVELIARKNLNNSSDQKFDSDLFLEISEIGLVTLDIEKMFYKLKKLIGIEIFDGTFEQFCAIGDENGLFICINKNKKGWFPTNDKAFYSEFELKLIEKGIEYNIEYKNKVLKHLNNN